MDYGSVVIVKLGNQSCDCDRVQNAALSTCLGGLRTPPVSILQLEVGELPLEL